MSWKNLAVIGICAIALPVASSAARANLVLNGSFESYTPGALGAGDLIYSPLANWSSPAMDTAGSKTGNLLFTPGSADTTGSLYDDTPFGGTMTHFTLWGPNDGSNNGLPATSPDGGNFVGLDADPLYSGPLSQVIHGLTAGQSYQLSFFWGGAQLTTATGATTEQLQVSFGSQTQVTAVLNNASEGFTGWKQKTMTFTADGSSDTLSFLALGTPSGLPPFVLLDGVTLNPSLVPEPSSIVLLTLGTVGVFGVGLRRRAKAAKAANL